MIVIQNVILYLNTDFKNVKDYEDYANTDQKQI